MSAAASGQNCAPAVWRVSRADLVGVLEAAARRAPGRTTAEPGADAGLAVPRSGAALDLRTAEEDNMLARNPCRIRGAGNEHAAERPVLTVAQVFGLAERVGRRPVGNIRQVQDGYRLRFSRHGAMRNSPERCATRRDAERVLWKMANDGRADCTQDRRFYALVLLATFASLRWGEATALRRTDLDLESRTVRIRVAYVERSNGEMLLGPPKSEAGRRVVSIPAAIIAELREHLAIYVKADPGALVSPSVKGGPLRRGNFNKMSAWPHAVESIGMPGLRPTAGRACAT